MVDHLTVLLVATPSLAVRHHLAGQWHATRNGSNGGQSHRVARGHPIAGS